MGREQVRAFLHEQKHLAADLDLDYESSRFHDHMTKGLQGVPLPDALPMIPTYLSLGTKVEPNEPVIVMDAGGTNFRICLVRFDERMDARIDDFKMFPMPGADKEVSKKEFFGIIADAVIPYLDYSRTIGFCFSYACEILPNKDGRILNFSKEVKCPEAVGSLVGESLKEAIAAKSAPSDVHIVILNDTVAALLGGFAKSNARAHSGYVGLILGTGINIAYLEENLLIPKLRGKVPMLGNMIINTEAGDYRIATRSVIDLEIDDDSQAPATYSMEKQISGRYQGIQVLYTLKKAIEVSDLFSKEFAEAFAKVDELASEELDRFLRDAYGDNILANCCATDDDRDHAYFIADDILERAAKLVTIIFTGVFQQMNKGMNPTRPLAITVEGSTFYKSARFRHHLEYYVKSYLNEKKGYYADFLQVEHANLIGSAIAALMNK